MNDDKIATPILKWAYSSKDGNLQGTTGSSVEKNPLPKPVSGDYIFTETPTLSGN
jgi:hypothetical protein